MTTKNINTYTIRELKKANKDAFDRVINSIYTNTQKHIEKVFYELYEKLAQILENNYYNVEIKRRYNSYCSIIKYKGNEECDPFEVIDDIKNNLDLEFQPWTCVDDYLKYNCLNKNENNAVDYLTTLFETLFKIEKNEKKRFVKKDVIKFIECKGAVFTFNGIDTNYL